MSYARLAASIVPTAKGSDAGRARDTRLPRRRDEKTRRTRFRQKNAGMGFRGAAGLRGRPAPGWLAAV
jgi:hypothetical protein